MGLLEYIKKAPLLRPNSFPNSHNLAIVCRAAAITHIPDSLMQNVRGVFVFDHKQNLPREIGADRNGQPINVFPISVLAGNVSFDIVHFHHSYDYGVLADCAKLLARVGYDSFFNFMPIPYNAVISTTHIPNYFNENKDSLEFVFNQLEDRESREVFAARIRALETGNVGYLRVSEYPEYFHPSVRPEEGDIIVDGGVSEFVGAQTQFSRAVGEQGRIYGFEPDPVGFCKANDALGERCPNYQVVPLGLWSRKDILHFNLSGQGTHVSSGGGQGSVQCEVISVDEFVKASRLKRVDLIKLDVEGAEAEAIKGAMETIGKFTPKLAISLYHTPKDLYHLPRLIREISGGYSYYLGHHHAALHETILYASPRKK
ncbi:FkbM family methyltransferase [Pseudodesulfovibrio sp. F-1]|uniref:FkbM family methyltransferase n=1 Tax=Pseudodesulfovibrio alkaliphilus TaxID=2661613 RepID=A0A7K1KPX5_9BACT|nr:FkbM family methyltransferase [Pseudodesulfovibrio alkaliphilus]MUM78144.1 FkbM family methyltransferase [Pseudodesulfovibrio alkaliphilus]